MERVRDVTGRSVQTSGQKISSSRTAKSLAARIKTETIAHSLYQVMAKLLIIRRKILAGQMVATFRLELEEVVWPEFSCLRGYKPRALPYLDGLSCEACIGSRRTPLFIKLIKLRVDKCQWLSI